MILLLLEFLNVFVIKIVTHNSTRIFSLFLKMSRIYQTDSFHLSF